MSLKKSVVDSKHDIVILEETVSKCRLQETKDVLYKHIAAMSVMVAKAESWLESTNTGGKNDLENQDRS